MDQANFLLNVVQDEPMDRVMRVQQQMYERQLHLLLPLVLMHQIAGLPASHPHFAELCTMTGYVSMAAMSTWKQLHPKQDAHCGGANPRSLLSLIANRVGQQTHGSRPGHLLRPWTSCFH